MHEIMSDPKIEGVLNTIDSVYYTVLEKDEINSYDIFNTFNS